MDKESLRFLKTVYNAPHHTLSILSKKCPLRDPSWSLQDRQRALNYLRECGYLTYDVVHCTYRTTIQGNEYVEQDNLTKRSYRLSVVAITISFLALIKPPYFDVIEIGKRLALWLLGLPQ